MIRYSSKSLLRLSGDMMSEGVYSDKGLLYISRPFSGKDECCLSSVVGSGTVIVKRAGPDRPRGVAVTWMSTPTATGVGRFDGMSVEGAVRRRLASACVGGAGSVPHSSLRTATTRS